MKRPPPSWNWALITFAVLLLLCSVLGVRQVAREVRTGELGEASKRAGIEDGVGVALTIAGCQVAICAFAVCSFLFVADLAVRRSFGFAEKWWNKARTTGFGISSLVFLVLAFVSTALRPEWLQFVGAFLLLAAFTAAVLCFVFWRREQVVGRFVERVLHANSFSHNFLTEQNARDLFELRECDRELAAHIRTAAVCCRAPVLRGVRHAEFYHLHRWAKRIQAVLDGRDEAMGTMTDIQKEMLKRTEIFEVGPDHARRYEQLAALPLLVLPGGETDEPTMTRDSSFLVHGRAENLSSQV